MYAADFRQRARLALRTRWAPAVLTALVASLLGAELFPWICKSSWIPPRFSSSS